MSGFAGIKMQLRQLTQIAWRDRIDPRVQLSARKLTYSETSRQDKMRALVDELHRRFVLAPSPVAQESVTVMDLFDIDKLDERMKTEINYMLSSRMIDVDEACVFVASAAMSVGIPCRFVGARYGHSWTCWLSYYVGAESCVNHEAGRKDHRVFLRATLYACAYATTA